MLCIILVVANRKKTNMYYNRFLGIVVFDVFDYFLISIIISIYCTEYLKFYFSEKQKMERLRQDLINKSKLVKSSFQTTTPFSATRVQKIYKFAVRSLSIRGGSEELLYKNAEQIKTLVINLLMLVRKRVNNKKIFNFIVFLARSYLRFILLVWQIDVRYCVDPVTGQTIVFTIVFGGTTGFIVSWIGVGATVFANFLGIILIGRSLAQQLRHDIEYRKFRNQAVKLIKDEEFQKTIVSIVKQIKGNNPKLQLNWEQNPALKEAAERLGIFEENPNGPIKSTENYLYNRYLKKLRKAAEKVVDVEANSDIIDVDFIAEDRPINITRIRIRD
jgi:hypothetical protein